MYFQFYVLEMLKFLATVIDITRAKKHIYSHRQEIYSSLFTTTVARKHNNSTEN